MKSEVRMIKAGKTEVLGLWNEWIFFILFYGEFYGNASFVFIAADGKDRRELELAAGTGRVSRFRRIAVARDEPDVFLDRVRIVTFLRGKSGRDLVLAKGKSVEKESVFLFDRAHFPDIVRGVGSGDGPGNRVLLAREQFSGSDVRVLLQGVDLGLVFRGFGPDFFDLCVYDGILPIKISRGDEHDQSDDDGYRVHYSVMRLRWEIRSVFVIRQCGSFCRFFGNRGVFCKGHSEEIVKSSGFRR
jgi:hypothetical protein